MTTKKMQTLFEQYEKVRLSMKELDQQEADLKKKIADSLIEEGVEKTATIYGSFAFTHKKTYVYSDKVKKLEEAVKDQKKLEQETADFTEEKFLVFRAL